MKIKKIALALLGAATLSVAASAQAATELKIWCWDDNFNVPAAKLAGERFAQRSTQMSRSRLSPLPKTTPFKSSTRP